MDPKFQTSFIPKRPMSAPVGMAPQRPQQVSRGSGAYMLVAVILFVISGAGLGGAYFWKQYLNNQQAQLKVTLSEKEQQFKPELISKLKGFNFQIDTASRILNQHIALSQIFKIVGDMTIEKVRFTSMDVTSSGQSSDGVKVTLTGYGLNLPTVAFQSDVLGSLENYGLRNIVKNPMLSNPGVGSVGTISFGLSATVDPSVLLYSRYFNSTQASSTNQ